MGELLKFRKSRRKVVDRGVEAEVVPIRRLSASLTADQLYERGYLLEEAGEIEGEGGAIDAYTSALALEPMHADASVNLGRILHNAGKIEAALSYYITAIAVRPGDALAVFNYGVALEDLGRTDDARAFYQRAVDLNPEEADAHYNLGRLLQRQGNEEAAARHMMAWRKLSPG